MVVEKNIKNPAVMSELFELSSCTSGLVPESKLSPGPQAQYGFVPKLSHPSGKNNKKDLPRPLQQEGSACRVIVKGRTMFFMFFPLMLSAVRIGEPIDDSVVCARARSQAQGSESAMKAVGR